MEITYKLLFDKPNPYPQHRIPGMIITHRGTMLIYCESRDNGSDWARMDVQLLRSTDGGKTFADPVILAHGTETHPTVNNPVMAEDKNGRVHFMYCEDYGCDGKVLRRYSDDDGVTWSDPIDITAFTLPDYRNVFAFGPGHGICKSDGTLLFTFWMVPKKYESFQRSHGPAEMSVLYSNDNGETWKVGDILETSNGVLNPGECEVAETATGGIYLNIRHGGCQRAVAFSETGYSNWKDYGPDFSLDDPSCFGSVASYDDGVRPRLVFANCDSKTSRNNVTVRLSDDGGRTWPVKRVIDKWRGGYVECAGDPSRGKIYVLYEGNWGAQMVLAAFDPDWVLSPEA